MVRIKMDEIEPIIRKSFVERLTAEERAALNDWLASDSENKDVYLFMENMWIWQHPAFDPAQINVDGKAFHRLHRKIREKSFLNSRVMKVFSRVACVLFFPLAIGFGIMFFLSMERRDVAGAMQEIRVPYGQQSTVTLSDGSNVWLNAGSVLRFPVEFDNQEERCVELLGEGYFEVEADQKHPFRVVTHNLQVVATGTEFNVDAYSKDSIVAVTMLKGRVAVQSADRQEIRKLANNERLVYNVIDNRITCTVENQYKYVSWKDGVLAFRNDRLDYVLKRLGYIYNVDIVIMDSDIAAYPYYATFNNESLDEILHLLSLSAPLKYEYGNMSRLDGSQRQKIYIVKSI